MTSYTKNRTPIWVCQQFVSAPTCRSGCHAWLDPISASRCCNGWHRELRLDGPRPSDDPDGRTYPEGMGAFVWVRDGVRATRDGGK